MLFEVLLGASAKAIKDFISHCYNRLKSIYHAFKRWLLEISGKFKAHDAFVNMCFGHMSDIEEFEVALGQEFQSVEDEIEECRSLLNLLVAQKSKTGIKAAWDKYFLNTNGSKYIPLNCQPSNEELQSKADKLEGLLSKRQQFETRAAKQYVKEKGRGFINTFNELRSRLRHVKEVTNLAEENRHCAEKIKAQLYQQENIEDLHKFTEVTKEWNGLTTLVTTTEGDETVQMEKQVKIDVRRIKDTDADREMASKWVHEYIKCKNATLSADELSMATIARYVENLADRHNLCTESKVYLKQCALLTVPIPSTKDINLTMAIQSPAARARREQMSILNSEGF